MSSKPLQLGKAMFVMRPCATAPGYRRAFTTDGGNISFAINCEDVTCIGVVHIPDLHGILKVPNNKQINLTIVRAK